ncbi:MAG: SPFH domain-containing protein [Flavobacteriales bacterium]
MKKVIIGALALGVILSSCAIIRPGETGIKRKLGKLGNSKESGVMVFNPFTSKIIKVPTRTINREILSNLPSKEGLTIRSEISILYRIKPKMTKSVIETIGLRYDDIVTSVFRSAAADVASKFYAKDMHSGEREQIEKQIAIRMNEILNPKGFEVEAVLLKSITMPPGISNAIEEKLRAEQDAQRMEFIKQREVLEADRKAIQAEGDKNSLIIAAKGQKEIAEIQAEGKAKAIKIEAEAQAEANKLLNRDLTPMLIQVMQVEAFLKLAESNNSKVIITDGKTPLMGLPTNK